MGQRLILSTPNQPKESLDGAVTLQDDDPILVARLLLYFYTSDYEPPEIKQDILGKIMNRAASSVNDAQPHEDESQMIVAAQMYGIAGKYGIKDLKDLCVERFAAGVRKASTTDLLALVDVVYEQTPDVDDLLRKWVVWRIQTSRMSMDDSNRLAALVYKQHDFARDMITKYAARNYVWCPDCKAYIELKSCRCGWSGICGGELCATKAPAKDLSGLGCTHCNTKGQLQFDKI